MFYVIHERDKECTNCLYAGTGDRLILVRDPERKDSCWPETGISHSESEDQIVLASI